MPIENRAESAIEFPAPPVTTDGVTTDVDTMGTITVYRRTTGTITAEAAMTGDIMVDAMSRVPTHSGDKSPQIILQLPEGITPKGIISEKVAPYYSIIPINDEWEEVEL